MAVLQAMQVHGQQFVPDKAIGAQGLVQMIHVLRLRFQSEFVALAVNDGVVRAHAFIRTRLSDYARFFRLSPAAYIT